MCEGDVSTRVRSNADEDYAYGCCHFIEIHVRVRLEIRTSFETRTADTSNEFQKRLRTVEKHVQRYLILDVATQNQLEIISENKFLRRIGIFVSRTSIQERTTKK